MYILAIDQGTTGTTAVLIESTTFKFVDKINFEHKQIFPKPAWVEHNLNEIWSSTSEAIKVLLRNNNVQPSSLKCIGITNQRETTCAFSKDGSPLANAIVWQDRRTEKFCNQLNDKGHAPFIKQTTGLPIDAYFSASKMNWLLNNDQNVKDAASADNLLFGNIDTFLLYKLTSGLSFKTDVTNASRTMLMNLDTLGWDNKLCEIFGVNQKLLPTICDSMGNFGHTKGLGFLPDGIPISGILGDQQSALFGQTCFNDGEMKCTYGTGAFMLLNTGAKKKYSDNGLLTTVAYKHNDELCYALEGSTYIAGACVQYLRDNLHFVKSAKDIESLALTSSLDNAKDVFFLPFFTGLGSPYWKSSAKACILGLTRDTTKAEISRAALEGIALSINDLITAMAKDLGKQLQELKVDGGAVANNLLLQIQSNFSNLSVVRPMIIETTAYGAGIAAAIGVGLTTKEKIREIWAKESSFEPTKKSEELDYYNYKSQAWNTYIQKLFL